MLPIVVKGTRRADKYTWKVKIIIIEGSVIITTPQLSITTTKAIGRLYQLPGGGWNPRISSTAARRGLYEAHTLFPSITNILGVLNKDLAGYNIYMMGKALREGSTIAEASKAPDQFRDMASARGSAIHLLIEQYIAAGNGKRTGKFLPMFRALAGWQDVKELGGVGYMDAFINFANDYAPTFLQQEATVFGSTLSGEESTAMYNYAGTTDFTAIINGVKVVGDWKATSKLHGTVARQLAAVRNATSYHNTETDTLEDWNGTSIEKAIAVRLCSDGTYEVKAADIDTGWKSFINLRAEWDNYAFGDAGLLQPFTPNS